jgi:hypothetical protein
MKRFARVVMTTLALVAGVTSLSVGAPTVVVTDSGTINEFSFVNAGISGGTATINVLTPSMVSAINTVNGVIVPPEPARITGPTSPFHFFVTPVGNTGFFNVTLDEGVIKSVGAKPGWQAVLPFNLSVGNVPASLPDFFNTSGHVTSVLSNNNPNYDFSNFSNGLGVINLTFTATSFTGATNFSDFFATPGATAVGNGSFSQSAVPEPRSLISLSTGLVFLALAGAYRRRINAWS